MNRLFLCALFFMAAAAEAQELPDAPKPKVIDRRFLIATAALAGSSIADGISTERMLARGCHELNPTYGRYPSPVRVAGTNAAWFAGEVGISYLLKRKFPRRHLWMLPFLDVANHTFASFHNELLQCP